MKSERDILNEGPEFFLEYAPFSTTHHLVKMIHQDQDLEFLVRGSDSLCRLQEGMPLNRYPIKGLLWDLDGTLIRSEHAFYRAQIREARKRFDHQFTFADQKKLLGAGAKAIDIFLDIVGSGRSTFASKEKYDELREEVLAERDAFVKLEYEKNPASLSIAGSFLAVKWFSLMRSSGFIQAISTTASEEQFNMFRNNFPWYDVDLNFDFFVHRDMVPDAVNKQPINQEAVRRCGEHFGKILLPSQLMMVEDTAHGAKYADKLGILTVVVPDDFTVDNLRGEGFKHASIIIPNAGMLPFLCDMGVISLGI